MPFSIKRKSLSVARSCGKALRRCMKSLRRIPLLRSCLRSNSAQSHEKAETAEIVDSQKAIVDVSAVDFEAQPKRTKRIRRRKGKSHAETIVEEPSKKTVDVLDADESISDAKIRTDTLSLIAPCSTANDQVETPKNENGIKSKKRRRTKAKPAADTLIPSSVPNNVEKDSCKSSLIVPDEEPEPDDDLSEWQVVKKNRKPRASRPDDVPRAKEQQDPRQTNNKTGKSFPSRFEAKNNNNRNYINQPVDALKKSGGDTANRKPPGMSQQRNTMGLKRNNGERFTAGARQKFIQHTKASSNNEIKLNKSENARIPTVAARRAAANKTDAETKRQRDETEEFKKSVNSILNNLTEENVVELTKNLAALPMDTVERLQNTADLIFEKVLQERNSVHHYASLCSDIKSLQATSDDGNNTVNFLSFILRKCQQQFKEDKACRANDVIKLNEINSCKDQEKKKKLRLEHQDNVRRLLERSVGNCRFIGELFKKDLIRNSIITYCITNLLEQNTDGSLECLCVLLKTAGKDLEKACKLNETFEQLKSLTLRKRISSKTKNMIESVIESERKL